MVTGVAGSLTGAYVLDRASASVPYALRFCAGVTLAAFILTTLTFQTTSLGLFIPTFAAAELAIFSINAVVSAAILWSGTCRPPAGRRALTPCPQFRCACAPSPCPPPPSQST